MPRAYDILYLPQKWRVEEDISMSSTLVVNEMAPLANLLRVVLMSHVLEDISKTSHV